MKFNFKNFQISKTKNFLIKNNFILFSYSANQNSLNWVVTEQGLHKLNFNYYKIYNNVTVKIIKKTIFENFLQIVNSSFFLLKTKQINNKLLLNKNLLIKNFQNIQFNLNSLKLNNKLYSISQFKKINSLKYNNSIKIFYQFLIANLKTCYTFTSKKK